MKISFEPQCSKQAGEVIFSGKTNKKHHPSLVFNNSNVSETNVIKHVSFVSDSHVLFKEHLKMILGNIYTVNTYKDLSDLI